MKRFYNASSIHRYSRHSIQFATNRALSNNSNDFVNIIRNTVKENVTSGYDALKGSIIGLMAKRMTDRDVQKLAEHWGKTINMDTFEVKQDLPSQEIINKPKQSEPRNPLSSLVTSTHDIELFHPILGELLIDLQYKKLYLTNVQSLAVAPVWRKNRILRPERASLIAQSKIQKGLGSSLPGVITFYADSSTNTVGIVDGQHRAAALLTLSQKGYWNDQDRNILIEVFPVKSETEVAVLFREINSAEPVRLIDSQMSEEEIEDEVDGSTDHLTSKSDTTSVDTVTVLNEATDSLMSRYPDMFKPSSRCRPPHLNIDVLRDDLFQSDFVGRARVNGVAINSPSDLVDYLIGVNARLGESLKNDDPASHSKYMQNAIKKAIANDFYLGINKTWIYDDQ